MRSAALLLLVGCALSGASARAAAGTFLVLPFFNLTGDPKLDWVGESLCVSIRETLASEGLLVYERDDRSEAFRRLSIRPYTQLTTASVLRLGEVLDAEAVIFGQFELLPPTDPASTSRGTLRVKAQLIDIGRAERITELSELGPLEELEQLQSHLAWKTWRVLAPESAPTRVQFEAQRARVPVEAIESYVRGLVASDPQAQSLLFTQATKVAPAYSAANFQLGRLELKAKKYAEAEALLAKVVPDDAHFREAVFLRGIALYHLDRFAEAAQAFQSVAESVPLNEVLNNLGVAQMQGEPVRAVETLQKAVEGDPSDPDYHYNLGHALLKADRFEAAASRFREVLKRRPGDQAATIMLGKALRTSLPPEESAKIAVAPQTPAVVLKDNYDESAYLQLKALLDKKN